MSAASSHRRKLTQTFAPPQRGTRVFERGPSVGADELLACGAISRAFYDELSALPKTPAASLVVKSVDRGRGIVTYDAVRDIVGRLP